MEKTNRVLVLGALAAGLTFSSRAAPALDSAAADTFAEAASGAPLPVEAPPLRFVVAPARRSLALPGAAFGAAFGGLLFGIPTLTSGGGSEEVQLTLLSAGLGGLVGGAVGAIQPRSQGSAELKPGDDVRVSSERSVRGTFVGASDAGVVVRLLNGEERVLPYRDALEVRRSTRMTGVGAVVGGAVTFAGVLFIHAVLCEGDCSDGLSPIAYAFVGGGAAVGGGLGALIKAHDWRPVTPEPADAGDAAPRRQISFKLAPAQGKGVRGQVAIRWR